MSDFPSIAFQSSLGMEAILFGVFGFLYSIFGTYSSLVTEKNPQRATIVDKLRSVCRGIALLICFNALLTICAILFMCLFSKDISGPGDFFLASGFVVIILVIAVFSLIWSFWHMD